ncbi:hypothetical protein M9H77_12180 [Catharanthus roseus]|uniref:Uncharacterized protein n=1 Tax=Catharanthus roseus TaxID=4058 RepID=A0ACC0BGS7_CATRO|nr:hypothetical protein M9H77_12180 [Catharanthus roseus]
MHGGRKADEFLFFLFFLSSPLGSSLATGLEHQACIQDLAVHRLTQDRQRHNKPLSFGLGVLDQFSLEGYMDISGGHTRERVQRDYLLLERDSIPMIDLLDSEMVERPVVLGVELGISIEEDPSVLESDAGMVPKPEELASVASEGMGILAAGGSLLQIAELSEEISRVDALYYIARQAHRQVTARAAMLETKLIEPAPSWSPGREVLIHDFPHADKAVSENSQSRQPEPIRENTPRPQQATHTVIENFMRNERVPTTRVDEALERFLKFRPPEFHGEVEQDSKAELFLEQLNDIYGILKYEDALRVTFAAFRLRGMANDWWLRASVAWALKNQPWTWNNFQEEFRKEYIPWWVRER